MPDTIASMTHSTALRLVSSPQDVGIGESDEKCDEPAVHGGANSDIHPKNALDLREIFDAYGHFVVRSVERALGPGQHVDDIVQETFITAWKKRDELNAGPGLKTWLYRTAMFKVMHAKRSFAKTIRLQSALGREPQDAHKYSIEQQMVDATSERARHQRLHRVLNTLSPQHKEVFILFELEGCSGAEVANLLEIPKNTVWSRLRVAREQFKARWVQERYAGTQKTKNQGGAS